MRKKKPNKGGRPPLADPTGSLDAEHEQARVRKYSADMMELKVRTRIGELLEAIIVRDVWNVSLSNFRAKILQLPSKLLPLIQASGSYAEAEAIFKAAINECLDELSEFDKTKLSNVKK